MMPAPMEAVAIAVGILIITAGAVLYGGKSDALAALGAGLIVAGAGLALVGIIDIEVRATA